MALEAKVLTVSSSVARGEATDRSGPAVESALEEAGFVVVGRAVVADGIGPVADALRALTKGFAGLVVTTGGTGFARSDLTPDATADVVERQAPGLAEAMRSASPKGRLSRAIAGTIDRCLVLNTPGSPMGAVECLRSVVDVVPHVLALMNGENPHPHN